MQEMPNNTVQQVTVGKASVAAVNRVPNTKFQVKLEKNAPCLVVCKISSAENFSGTI